MVDDDERSEPGTDETVRHRPARDTDAGRADTITALNTPTPLPPVPPVGGTLPHARAFGRRLHTGAIPAVRDEARYTFGALLGQGGMGDVVLATDEHIGREVAVKRIRAAAPSAEEFSRFVREARVQGRLEHPAVVPVHDLGVDRDGRPYFVMKRLAGTEMNEVLRRLRAGEEPDAAACRRRLLRAFADVCLAVEFAHSRGIIHRDLKPANIMLGDFGEVYVLDWGVARAITDPDDSAVTAPAQEDLVLDSGVTGAGTVLGTPAYMAPEQLAGERAGPAADIYALGCILFEIAAGESLHPRTRAIGQAYLPVDARPSRRRAEAPPELDAICERAIRTEPAARYATARALGDAVQAFLDGDRDHEARAALARHHLGEARAALARGDTEEDRRAAMRAAGRALALDPTTTEAADLVTHLVLRPPVAVPAEVEQRLAVIDTDTARAHARLAAFAMTGYLAFIPLFLWTGVRDALPIAIFAALAIASGAQILVMTRRERISTAGVYFTACVNAALIAIVSRMVGPFVIAPTLVTTTLMAYAAHPQLGQIRVVAAILTSAVAVPWALEAAGALPETYRFVGGDLVLTSSVIEFSAAPVQLAFAILLVGLVAVVAILCRTIATRQRAATQQLELQAWHLRQIVPTSAPR